MREGARAIDALKIPPATTLFPASILLTNTNRPLEKVSQ
jgi:hypothetical protein